MIGVNSIAKMRVKLTQISTFLSSELLDIETQFQIKRELQDVLTVSRVPALGLFILILLQLEGMALLAIWIYILIKCRSINKEEKIMFEKRLVPLYRIRTFWVKVISLSIAFICAKLGTEIMYVVRTCIEDSDSLLANILCTTSFKWLSFIQYFTFYRVYVYLCLAFGSYLNPLIQRKVAAAETNSFAKNKDGVDRKNKGEERSSSQPGDDIKKEN